MVDFDDLVLGTGGTLVALDLKLVTCLSVVKLLLVLPRVPLVELLGGDRLVGVDMGLRFGLLLGGSGVDGTVM